MSEYSLTIDKVVAAVRIGGSAGVIIGFLGWGLVLWKLILSAPISYLLIFSVILGSLISVLAIVITVLVNIYFVVKYG